MDDGYFEPVVDSVVEVQSGRLAAVVVSAYLRQPRRRVRQALPELDMPWIEHSNEGYLARLGQKYKG